MNINNFFFYIKLNTRQFFNTGIYLHALVKLATTEGIEFRNLSV